MMELCMPKKSKRSIDGGGWGLKFFKLILFMTSYNHIITMDDIASVNFFYIDIIHVEGSAYAHSTDFQTDRRQTDGR